MRNNRLRRMSFPPWTKTKRSMIVYSIGIPRPFLGAFLKPPALQVVTDWRLVHARHGVSHRPLKKRRRVWRVQRFAAMQRTLFHIFFRGKNLFLHRRKQLSRCGLMSSRWMRELRLGAVSPAVGLSVRASVMVFGKTLKGPYLLVIMA
jgi:hypothetical protein